MRDKVIPKVWNEPGGNDKNQNPWGKNRNDGPPDLDQVFKDLKKRFFSLFNKKPSGAPPDPEQQQPLNLKYIVIFIVGGFLALYIIFGFYTIASYEQGVITRLGKYDRTVTSGLHWRLLLLDVVHKVNTENLKSSRHSGWMLTEDENIILVEVEVQYRVVDAEKYLFNVASPDTVLAQAADSALRQVVGESTADDVLTNKKSQIAESIKEQLIELLESYGTGFYIEAVNFRDSRPPDEVKDAFDDVTKSREDRERLKHQAEAYANNIIPKAEGDAQKILAEAEAYKQQVILDATGEAQRFNLILPGYQKAPQVTKTRMYLDTIEEVLSNTTKIIVNDSAGNNMIYLPLDKIIGNHQETSVKAQPEKATVSQNMLNNNKEKR